MASSLTLADLTAAVTSGAAGIRSRISLEPLGGPGDKVAPPTYGVADREPTKYAVEHRRINGIEVPCVLLNSVASSANAMELELLQALRAGELVVPLISTDFRGIDGVAHLDRISSLQAPHRVFDALLRDSLLGEDSFRLSPVGRAITEASPSNAAALFRYSPTTLVFGGWDSTGPKGGLGAKYERALTSEIVGIGATLGVKTASRIDPAGIEIGPTIWETPTRDWTLDPQQAQQDKGKPKVYKRTTEGAGKPSQINHGNITPSIDTRAGGVTVDRIEAVTVLSLIQLRRLRFPLDAAGRPFGPNSSGVQTAAQVALAALALAAVTLSFEAGFDLRSRCVLVPTQDLEFELVRRGTSPSTGFSLTRSEALALVDEAATAAAAAGLTWDPEEVLLTPAPRLVDLIRGSAPVVAEDSEL